MQKLVQPPPPGLKGFKNLDLRGGLIMVFQEEEKYFLG